MSTTQLGAVYLMLQRLSLTQSTFVHTNIHSQLASNEAPPSRDETRGEAAKKRCVTSIHEHVPDNGSRYSAWRDLLFGVENLYATKARARQVLVRYTLRTRRI